jgi:hypothetical protein
MKRIKLRVARERLRNMTYAELRPVDGGQQTTDLMDAEQTVIASDTCWHQAPDYCTAMTSETITHQRSYQIINTIC